jgi:mRNA interferase MazF
MELNQYWVVLVNFDPTIGSEIKKTRPCVIISPNEMNHFLRTIVIAPMTSQSRDYPSRVKITQNNKDGWVLLDQIHTIDKQRIIKVFDRLSEKEIEKVKLIIKEIFVD